MKQFLFLVTIFMFGPECVSAQTTISGYAISLDTGEPVSGAEIILKDRMGLEIEEREPARTAADGSFEFNDVEPGLYILHASTSFDKEGEDQVLVSNRFDVPATGEEIHVGFWRRAMDVSQELSSAIRDAEPGEQEAPRNPVRYDLEGSRLLFARARLLRPKMVAGDGRNLLNVAYPTSSTTGR